MSKSVQVVYHMCAWYLQMSEEDIKSPETGVAGGCKPPRVFWESNSGPLEEQVLLSTEYLSSPFPVPLSLSQKSHHLTQCWA